LALAPLNRLVPEIKLKKKLPRLKISALVVAYLFFKISGATYPGEPHFILNSSSSVMRHAMPRSVMQTDKSF
jgi:hypothetical protein